jgi:hypothetical protein
MTFNEAKKLKEEIGDTYEYEGQTYAVLVVPSDEIGRKLYFSKERSTKNLTDERATIYSTDFEVNAVYFLGADSFYKRNLKHP